MGGGHRERLVRTGVEIPTLFAPSNAVQRVQMSAASMSAYVSLLGGPAYLSCPNPLPHSLESSACLLQAFRKAVTFCSGGASEKNV